MTGPPSGDAEPHEASGTREDWATIWRSEMNALAVDREPAEAWAAALALGAAWIRAAAAFVPPAVLSDGIGTEPVGRAGSAPAAGAAAPMAASRDGDVGKELAERVAELERRLAELERL